MGDLSKDELDHRATLLVKDFKGIHPPTEAFYIRSICYSASRASEGFQRFDRSRAQGENEVNQVSAVHEALGHAAALSRFSWQSPIPGGTTKAVRKLREARASNLRDAFCLTDESPLKSRTLRDSLEHFDERLDVYLLKNDAGYFFPDARIGDEKLTEEALGHIFKMVDPVTCCFVCLGERHYFHELRNEVSAVLDRAIAMEGNGCRLRVSKL